MILTPRQYSTSLLSCLRQFIITNLNIMAGRKKVKIRNRHGRKTTYLPETAKKPGNKHSLSNKIIDFLTHKKHPVSISEIMKGLRLPKHSRGSTRTLLKSLSRNGQISREGKKFTSASNNDLIEATLSITRQGFGFASLDGKKNMGKDIFIKEKNLNGAGHDDTVLIRIIPAGAKGRQEGVVVEIKNRAHKTFCGIYSSNEHGAIVLPDNPKLGFILNIPAHKSSDALNGQAVVATITDYGNSQDNPSGEIVEVLGDPLTVPVQIRMAIEEMSLPREFPPEVIAEAENLQPVSKCEDGRKDLRDVFHVTIDGITARDFDDAICVEKRGKGFRLFVSIADVSYYVKPGTLIDKEAYRRGTSVYFPDMVLPMLPERLSNDLCSLVPHQDRPAFTAILDFNQQGKLIESDYCRSLIRSKHRFTYEFVHELIYLENKKLQQECKDAVPMLQLARRLSALLRDLRTKRGSLGFTIPEAIISTDKTRVSDIKHSKRNEAHLLIEDFMLSANEAVAETLDKKKQPTLFRVHEDPDQEKVKEFTNAAAAMGIKLPRTEISPAWFAQVLKQVQGQPTEYVINNLLLRTMQQARYAPENLGHFGLAAPFYLHFTSPIRRYPDLIAHRALADFIEKKEQKQKNLQEAGEHLSKRERIAINGERSVKARLSCLFLADKIGEEFEAVISGVNNYGLFIELLDLFISGHISLQSMKDDYYILESKTHRIRGENSNKVYQMGDIIKVRLEDVNLREKRNTFIMADTNRQ